MTFSARLTSPFFMWLIIILFLLLILNFAWKACSAASASGDGSCGGAIGAFFPCCAGAGEGAAGASLQGRGNDTSMFYVLIFWSLVAAFIFAILSGQLNF